MLSKQGIKFNLIVAAIFCLAGENLYADSASNYSGGSQQLVTKPAPIANQTFLLDSGDVNFTTSATWSGMVCSSSNTAPPPNCIGSTTVNQNCPTGFVPYVSLSVKKSLGTSITYQSNAAGVSGVCVDSFWGHSTPFKGYEFSVQNSVATSGGNPVGTSIAFRWEIYCMPGTYGSPVGTGATPTPNNWSYGGASCSDSNPGACSGSAPNCSGGNFQPSFAYDKEPLLWDTGSVLPASDPPTILTNRVCPRGYYPHIVLGLNKFGDSYSYAMTGYTSSHLGAAGLGLTFLCPVDSAYTGPVSGGSGGTSTFYNTGTQYRMQLAGSRLNGGNYTAGATWSLYCYPGGVWPTSSGTEYDTSCSGTLQSSTVTPITWTYSFSSLNSTATTMPGGYNTSYTYVQSFPGTGLYWWIAPQGPFITNPGWPAIWIPLTGTYQFVFNVKANSSNGGQPCMVFYLCSGAGGGGGGSTACAGYGPTIGALFNSSGGYRAAFGAGAPANLNATMSGSFRINAGTPVFLIGYEDPACSAGTVNILSTSNMTMTYTGP